MSNVKGIHQLKDKIIKGETDQLDETAKPFVNALIEACLSKPEAKEQNRFRQTCNTY